MPLWTYLLRETLRCPARSLLTVIGIAVGVATVVASATSIAAARRSYGALFDGDDGPAALEVAATSNASFPAPTAKLDSLAGIRAVVPEIQSVAALSCRSGAVPAVVLGVDVTQGAAMESVHRCAGRLPRGDDEILLDTTTADANGLALGGPVRLWSTAGQQELRLVGRLAPSRSGPLGTARALVSLATAQRLFAMPGQVNRLRFVLAEGAEERSVAVEVARRLPAGLSIQPPALRAAPAEATRAAAEQGLAGLSALALIAAAFVVLNTSLMHLGEREREIALLRSLGATMRQVRVLLLGQAALLGTVGAILGCGVGLVLALVLLRVMGGFLGVPLDGAQPGAWTFLLAPALGIGIALAATYLPVRRAASRPVLDGLYCTRSKRDERLPHRTALLGFILLTAAGVVLAGVGDHWFPSRFGPILLPCGVAVLLVGGALVAATCFPLLLGLFARTPRAVLGIEGELAIRHLQLRPVRTALTAGVQFVVVVMAVGFGQVLTNTLGDLRQWCRRTIPADCLIRGSVPDTAFLLATALPESLAEDIAAVPGVAHVARISFLPATVDGEPVLLLARTFDDAEPLPLDLREGEAAAVLSGLRRGEVVVGSGLAAGRDLHRGDTVTLETPHGPQRLRIAGTATEFAGGGRAMYIEWNTAKRFLSFPGAHVFLVSARPGDADVIGPRLKNYCEQHGLLLQTNAELRRVVDDAFEQVVAAFWALIALAFLIASVGVANTLLMNVREQARDLAILRALGMTRRGVRRVILWQAGLLGLVSLVPGTVFGLGLAWGLHRSVNALLGSEGDWQVDPRVLLGCAGLVMLVALAAALVPAQRAVRMKT